MINKTLLLCLVLGIPAVAPSRAQHADVESVARGVLAAISARDSTAFMSYMAPGARAFRIVDGTPRFRDATVDASGLAAPGPAYLERMWDPEIRIDGDLAMVWTRYDFWLDKAFSHCGTDVFTLVKSTEGWRMTSITYNVSRDCPESPLGDPTF